jgi:hypothetical protein
MANPKKLKSGFIVFMAPFLLMFSSATAAFAGHLGAPKSGISTTPNVEGFAKATIMGDVIVSPPWASPSPDSAAVRLTGEVGATQGGGYLVFYCSKPDSVDPRFCDRYNDRTFVRGKINDWVEVNVDGGLVFVCKASVCSTPVTIVKGQRIEWKLSKIIIEADASTTAQVFADFSGSSSDSIAQQLNFLNGGGKMNSDAVRKWCREPLLKHGSIGYQFCTDKLFGSFDSWLRWYTFPENDGTVMGPTMDLRQEEPTLGGFVVWGEDNFISIDSAHLRNGEFVGVLPGIYGLKFSDESMGRTAYRRVIVD